MNPMNQGRATGARPSSAWSFAVALALALGPAGCAGTFATGRHDNDVPPVQAFQIRTVQRALSDRGFRVRPTGEWDEATRSAAARFQASKGLLVTGQLDWATARELGVNLDPMYNCETNDTVDCGPAGGL